MRKLLAAILAALAGGLLATAEPASAKSTYMPQFEAAYPAATGSRIDACTLCHTTVPSRNSYGTAWANANRSFTAINAADSDGDGFTNLVEINDLKFPGNAADRPTVADAAAPTVDTFDVPAASTSLTVSILAFTASDDIGVTGYLLTQTATTPAPGAAAGWTTAAPTTYTFTTTGTKTLYAWAKDASGKISTSRSDTVVISLPPDAAPPTVNAFDLPAESNSLTVGILAFAASDDVGVTGYLLTQSPSTPAPDDAGWSAAAPASYTFASLGSQTLYAWAKDLAGNVSTSLSDTVLITDTVPPPPPPPPGQILSSDFSGATAAGDPDWDRLVGALGGVRQTFVNLVAGRSISLADNALAGLAPYLGGRVVTKVRFVNPLLKTRAEILFDYVNGRNYRYVRLDNATRRVVIGQVGSVGGEGPSALSVRQPRLFATPGTWHRLRLDIDPVGGSVKVYVDKSALPALTKTYAETGIGRVGLAAIGARRTVNFDNFLVWDTTVLP